MSAANLTPTQKTVLAALSVDRGIDVPTLAQRTGQPKEGAAATASSLIRRGLALRFVGGVLAHRVHYQLTRAGEQLKLAENHDHAYGRPVNGRAYCTIPGCAAFTQEATA